MRLVGLLLFFILLALTSQRGQAPIEPSQTPTPAQTPSPKRFTPADLAKLRWIEGTWRGTGDVEKPFFERYHFENESTLVSEGFTDETLSKLEDEVTRFELKDGQFGNGGEGSRWAAIAIDETSVTFAPIAKARNSFRWQRESDNSWKAILTWPATDTAPARLRIYLMERIQVKSQVSSPKSQVSS